MYRSYSYKARFHLILGVYFDLNPKKHARLKFIIKALAV